MILPSIRRQFPRATLLLGMCLGAVPAWAQSSGSAGAPAAPAPVIEAIAYGPIPAGARFETQANDTSELNQEALDRVNARLAERGYGVDDQAPLVMVVETDLVRAVRQDSPLGQATVNNANSNTRLTNSDPNTRVDATVQARLFSTTQNSLLNPQQPIPSAERLYRISLAVYNRASGLYVWRATASRNNPDTDIGQASDQMIAALVADIGRTVKAPGK